MSQPAVILVHLGASIPHYLKDCVHQLRLWNSAEALTIFLVLEPSQKQSSHWEQLAITYSINIVYTDTLSRSHKHTQFLTHFKGDTEFRNGYWRFVTERFFYMEELMQQVGLTDCIAMEYDVLVYTDLAQLLPKLQAHAKGKLAMVMDNETRGHPGFLYIGGLTAINEFTEYILSRIRVNLTDMQLLAAFWEQSPEQICFLPVITPVKNKSIFLRYSLGNKMCSNSWYLSDGFEILQSLFDSLVIGQALAGIDPRNTGDEIVKTYENESAFYSPNELIFEWKKTESGLWQPTIDSVPLNTIHMHSKALESFLSDRSEIPVADCDYSKLRETLEKL